MSCHLVAEDFTDCYFFDTIDGTDTSDTDTFVDDGSGSDTDVASISSDGIVQTAPWQSMAQLAAFANRVFAEHAPAHLRLARQQHIIDRIAYFAMQAKNNEIILPSSSADHASPTTATALLCINHDLYHQCRETLYRDNVFVVRKFGAGLRHLSKQLGFHYCGEVCASTTAISSIRFEVGCKVHDGIGLIKMEAFTQALKDLNRPITVKHLRIDFLPFCFVGDPDLAAFAAALKEKVRVERVFEMTGLDVHWECDLRMVPKALGMKLEPLVCDYIPHNDKKDIPGFFGCSYEPDSNEDEGVGSDAKRSNLNIKDGRYYYELHQLGLHQANSHC
ncbi:MAG: hypothetical protein L6R40_002892 [Gallowayella cf. fulva]|nr:MAG: hypothetical protein L6R40_002892 [Xanthomendoza cf. fulva]